MNNIYATKIHPWLEEHPWVGLPANTITFLYRYITSFRWVIDIVRWMVTTAGNIAESAFLLATVYVTTNTVAHLLVTWILPDHMITTLNQVSIMAFSVLPELIIASAMKTTFDHWKLALRTKRVDAWIWAGSYTIPTLVFLVMTILTISTFVNFEAVNATPPQATGLMLVTRCLAGWTYGMVQILYVSIGKQGYVEALDDLKKQVHTRDEELSNRAQMISALQKDITILQEQMAHLEHTLFDAQMALATRRMARTQREVYTSKRGRAGTKQGSVVHLLKKDEEQTGNGSAHNSDVNRDVHEDVNSDARSDLECDVNKDQTGIETGNKSALNEDVNKDGDSDVNKELDREQTGISKVNIMALYSDANSDQPVHLAENKSALNEDVHRDVNKEQKSDVNQDLTGNKTASKTRGDGSEAVKKIQRILRRNPNTGPAELAAKTGVSRRYASQVKSQFLTALAAEQSA